MTTDSGPFRDLSRFRYAMRRFLAASEEISRAGGITQQQYQVLLEIKATESGQLTIRALADRLLLTHHAAVQMIDRLAKAGLAERTPSPSDRRAVLLRLTDKGDALVEGLARQHLAEVLRQEPLIRRSLDQLRALPSPAAKGKGAAKSRGPRAP